MDCITCIHPFGPPTLKDRWAVRGGGGGGGEMKSPYSTGYWVRVGYPTQMKLHKQHETCMANVRILHGDPTRPIFHLLELGVGVGGWWLALGVGARTQPEWFCIKWNIGLSI